MRTIHGLGNQGADAPHMNGMPGTPRMRPCLRSVPKPLESLTDLLSGEHACDQAVRIAEAGLKTAVEEGASSGSGMSSTRTSRTRRGSPSMSATSRTR